MIASVNETWNDYGKGLRWTFRLSMLLGIAIFVAGVIGDWRGWWKDLNFWPNAMTSLSGFFIGVPVALVLLSTLQAEREEKSELDKLNGLSDAAWKEFCDRVDVFCSADRISAHRVAHDEITKRWSEIAHGIRKYFGTNDPAEDVSIPSDDEYAAFVVQLPKWADDLDSALRKALRLRSKLTLEVEWAGIRQSWNMLNSYIKVRRTERKKNWIRDPIDSRLQRKLMQAEMPIAEFNAIHDTDGGFPFGAMGDFSGYLRRCANMSKEEIQQSMKSADAPAYGFPVEEYSSRALAAAEYLRELKSDVSDATSGDDWPSAYTR
jgi:hypothetical protein